MAEILHKLSIRAPRERVFQALATREGLAGWWTSTTEGESAPGKTLTFRFGEHAIAMRVEELAPGARVTWTCTAAAPEWVGTKLTFELSPPGSGEVGGTNGPLGSDTTVRFAHRGWPEASDFLAHCSTKWATFLLSLREYAETGKGRPFPHDLPA